MSVAEINPGSNGDPQFDRTPPQDIAAEQSVLGGMLLSKDAIADVVEVLRSGDFYRPAHGLVYDTVLDLYGRGEPADAVTVAAELTRRGEIAKAGGAPYLHTLIASVPTAANAGYYATIVAEQAILRRLVVAGTRIVQMGYRPDAEVDDIVDRAQAEVYEVTERRTSEDFVSLGMILPGTLDEIEAISNHDGGLAGVPTGFKELDDLTNGLHPGQMIVVAARPAVGKALALDTPLPTPDGWTTMGEVKVGDYLIDADGKPTRVVAATDVMVGRPCFEVEFSDGTVIVADAQHQWLTWDLKARKAYDYAAGPDSPPYPDNWPLWAPALPSIRPYAPGERDEMRRLRAEGLTHAQVGERMGRTAGAVQQQWKRVEPEPKRIAPRTTAELATSLRVRGQWNHGIPATKPVLRPVAALPIDPYVLGYLLGDGDTSGCGRVACDPRDREWLLEEFAQHYSVNPHSDPGHFSVHGIQAAWRGLGLADGKHVPDSYLNASVGQRIALLQGLVDSDGTVDGHGSYSFSNTNRALIDGFCELAAGLGAVPRVYARTGRVRAGRVSADSWTVLVSTGLPLARLPRKALAARRVWKREQMTRYVTAVRPVESVPVRCVEVDNPAHLYLASRSFIPTHNSTLGMDIVRSCSIKNNMASVFFSLEMGRTEITMRLLSAESRIPLHHMRTGNMSDEDWAKLARRMGEVAEAPLFIDDSPNLTMMEIRAKARRLKQRHDLKLVVVDYLQLMTSGKRVESRQQEVAEFSRSLKLLAKELEVPVIALSQLNRGPEQRTDKKPMLSDLRESGCLPASTLILRADNGQQVSLGDLFASGAKDVPVWSLDDSLRYVRRHLTHVFSTGVREVFKLTLASGKQVRATANHPFLTYDGWRALGTLEVGGRVAVPRHVPAPDADAPWSDEKVTLLAHLIGDGSYLPRQPLRYATQDEDNVAAVTWAAAAFGVTAVRDEYEAARCTTVRLPSPHHLTHGKRNPIVAWLDELGVFGQRSHEKRVPHEVFSLPKRQIRLFLRHLWATDGSVTVTKKGTGGRVYYASTSRELCDDVSRLLLRFGISTRLRSATKPGYRPGWTLDISGADDHKRFLGEIGVHGARGRSAEQLLSIVQNCKPNTNVDTVPRDVWQKVRRVLVEKGVTQREFAAAMGTAYCGTTMWKHAPSRERLARVAAVLDDSELELMATNDVLWDEIVSIEPDGVEEVYDATVLGNHNFIADGIAVHNSIEQDADMVILLHREDLYEKESPRAGEADFIVAKHRNGPTKTVTVAFQGHYSRFVDMQQS